MRRCLLFSATLLFAFVLAVTLSGCARESRDTLRVGMELAYPPFEMTDEQGRPAGVSVDLAHALGAFLHKTVVVQNIAFDGLIPSLKTGKIDLVISSMTATPERAHSIDFSNPYLTTGLALLANANSPVQSIEDLQRPGTVVAVKKGTTGHLYAVEHLRSAQLLVLDKENACVLEVAQGKAAAFIYDQMSVLQNWQQHKEATRALLTPFKVEHWAIGVQKGNDSLRTQVNAFLADYRARGGFAELGDRWLHDQKAAFQNRGIPFVF
jgi:polar amino acid transport system substrate-binding protein